MAHYIYSAINEEIQREQDKAHADNGSLYDPILFFEKIILSEISKASVDKGIVRANKLKALLRESTSENAFTITIQLNEAQSREYNLDVMHFRYTFMKPGICINHCEQQPEQIKMSLEEIPNAAELFIKKILMDFPPQRYTFLEAPPHLASDKYLNIGLQIEEKIGYSYSRFFQFAESKSEQKPQETPLLPAAVLSIQTLDHKKVAFSPTNVATYYAEHANILLQPGDGHTGFAIAKAIQAPFVTMRSSANRNEQNKALSGHIANNGLLIVTGHSSPSENITGFYSDSPAEFINLHNFHAQIERGPSDIVQSVMEAGLTPGSHFTILLCICYGAQNEKNEDNTEKKDTSFAYRLAKEFAEHGISTTIIASDQPVNRFGANAINNETGNLSFNEKIGIAQKDICIFKTIFGDQGMEVQKYKPMNTNIMLTKGGMLFSSDVNQRSIGLKANLHASKQNGNDLAKYH